MAIGSWALSSLLADDLAAAPKQAPHFAPKAKSVIFLYMMGAPSQVDLFDHKADLQRLDGQPIPESVLGETTFAFVKGRPNLMGSPYRFSQHGQSGSWFSELLPSMAKVADDLTFIHTMQTDEFGHGAAEMFLQSGFGRLGRPSFGAWVSYGLGSENKNLPAYVVLAPGATFNGSMTWTSGFLPSLHQGVKFRAAGDPIFFLSNPPGVTAADQQDVIGAVSRLNGEQAKTQLDPEIDARIGQYEMAFRMQSSVPELTSLKDEPPHVLELYGAKPGQPGFANDCILARRMVERGVRFVQVCTSSWDHHEGIYRDEALPRACRTVDKASAALITDLKQRGLLDDTLVVWGAEFGRTPIVQAISPQGKRGDPGRDHHKDAFTIWLAGGGVKPGVHHGLTDDFGFRPVENPVHVHDFHATALHLLGLDHERLTYRYQGRNFRLTDVHGHVVKQILA